MKRLFLIMVLLSVPHLTLAGEQWSSHPVMKSEGCDALEYTGVAEFMAAHYYPAVSNLNGNNATSNFVNTYSMSSALILRSQACLAQALELKDLTKELQKTQQIISGGTSMSKSEIKKHRELTAKANAEITEAAEKIKKLSPKQQKSFSLGTSTYFAGTYATAKLFHLGKNIAGSTVGAVSNVAKGNWIGALGDVAKSVKNLATKDTGKVATLVSGFQGHAQNIYSTSKFLLNYSKQRNIKLPADATKDLGAVSDWV